MLEIGGVYVCRVGLSELAMACAARHGVAAWALRRFVTVICVQWFLWLAMVLAFFAWVSSVIGSDCSWSVELVFVWCACSMVYLIYSWREDYTTIYWKIEKGYSLPECVAYWSIIGFILNKMLCKIDYHHMCVRTFFLHLPMLVFLVPFFSTVRFLAFCWWSSHDLSLCRSSTEPISWSI